MHPAEALLRTWIAELRRIPAIVWVTLLGMLTSIAGSALLWFKVVIPLFIWVSAHPVLGAAFLVAGALGSAVARSAWTEQRTRRESARRAREQEDAKRLAAEKLEAERAAHRARQLELGLMEYVPPIGPPMWGTPQEVAAWRELEATQTLAAHREARLLRLVEEFRPLMWYESEAPYQAELAGWLKAYFPQTHVEVQRGSSRPDIVVEDVAIEVKGPTREGDLQTIADKCMRYSQHFSRLVLVLFRVEVSEGRYREWERGIKTTYPDVTLIRVDPMPTPVPAVRPPSARESHPAICSACEEATRVPFKPDPRRPVYCLACLSARSSPPALRRGR